MTNLFEVNQRQNLLSLKSNEAVIYNSNELNKSILDEMVNRDSNGVIDLKWNEVAQISSNKVINLDSNEVIDFKSNELIQTTRVKKTRAKVNFQMTRSSAQRAQLNFQAFVIKDNLDENKLQIIY